MKNIYLATSNINKVQELTDIINSSGLKINIATVMGRVNMPVIEETADTFSGNAKLKAFTFEELTTKNTWVLADDSGLMVDAIQGNPGVYSSRYAKDGASDSENINKLLKNLKDIEGIKRSARFVCILALIGSEGFEITFKGVCKGFIAKKPEGKNGFGYDPIFIPEGHTQTFGVLDKSIKSKISHRARALTKLICWLGSKFNH